jgi:hypothetical protein
VVGEGRDWIESVRPCRCWLPPDVLMRDCFFKRGFGVVSVDWADVDVGIREILGGTARFLFTDAARGVDGAGAEVKWGLENELERE